MGTRGLTMVLVDGVERVAQYGQWDHYPEGQGVKVLEFCRENLKAKRKRATFKAAVKRTRFITDAEFNSRWKEFGHDPETGNGMVSCDLANQFGVKYPALSRNTGGEILDLILAGETVLQDTHEFINESLFCEQAYCVNLDSGMLEVYEGVQKAPHDKGRYSGHVPEPETCPNGNKASPYYACALVAEYPLGKLPSKAKFLAELEPPTGN